MKVKGIFFDLYGTLIVYGDMEQAWSDWLSTFYASLSKFGLEISIKDFSKICHGFFSKEAPKSQKSGLTVFEKRIQALCQDLELNLRDNEINFVATSCLNSWHEYVYLDPETVPVLESFKKNKKIALISNFDYPPHIHELLTELNLREYFDSVVISGEVGIKKPNPEIFSYALKDTGLNPNEVVYIGDSLEDIQGAAAANIFPILIRRQKKEISTDYNSRENSISLIDEEPILREAKKISKLRELLEIDYNNFSIEP
ncbi:MAG: HAD family hydrolase [Candidatus Hermodarchaeota archaeon]